jgi:hypothetical protein
MGVKITITFDASSLEAWTKPPDPFGERERQEILDLRRAECPYCGFALKKLPSAKTKCPGCKQWMTVRMRPADNARVVVRAGEAEELDAHWRVVRSAREPDFRFLTTKEHVDAERVKLRQQFGNDGGKDPSDDDVKWALLNAMANRHAAERDWGLYRNMRLTMADFLTRRMKFEEGMRLYLEVCALDLNGPANGNAHKAPELIREFPEFDQRLAFAAPAVLKQVRQVAARLAMDMPEQRKCFVDEYRNIQIALPLSAEVCWRKLETALNEPNKPRLPRVRS